MKRVLSWIRFGGDALDPRKSFRARVALAVGLLAVVLSQAASYYLNDLFVGQVKTDKGLLMTELAHQMANEMDKGIFERLHEIRIMSSLDALRDPGIPLERKRALLERLKASYEHYAWIGITDAAGNILAGTGRLLEGKNVADRRWFIQGAQAPAVGDVHDAFLLGKLLPKPKHDFLPLRLLDISAPIRDASGNLLGVLCGHLSWDWSYEVRNTVLEPLKKHAQADIVILAKNNHILLGTPELSKLTDELDLPSARAARVDAHGFLTEQWPDGANYLTGYAASRGFLDYPGLGWTVLVRQSTEDAFSVAEQLQRRSAVVALVFVLAFGLALWLTLGRLVRPLLGIAEAASRIGGSTRRAAIPRYSGQDELASLSRSLSDLVSTLETQKNELLGVERQLELAARVFSASNEGIIIANREQKILTVNQSFTEITGYEPADIVGRTPRLLSSGRQDRAFYQRMWQSIAAQGSWRGEIWNRRKSGEHYLESLIITSVKDGSGNATHYIGVFTDITERKRVEQALADTSGRLEIAITAAGAAVWDADLNTGNTYLGAQWAGLLGRPVESAEVLTLEELLRAVPEEERSAVRQHYFAVCKGEVPDYRIEHRIRCADGSYKWILSSGRVTARDEDGRAVRMTGVNIDISERKRAEQALQSLMLELERKVAQRTAELERANQDLESFSFSVSHDLRAPLRAIDGFAKLLREHRDRLNAEDAMLLERIERNIARMGDLIDEMLAFSRFGRVALQAEEVDQKALAGAAAAELAEAYPHASVVVGDMGKVKGDASMLRQVWVNLIDNALKYSAKRAAPRVEAGEAQLAGERVFYVKDNGIGFDMRRAGKLFGVFQRLHQERDFPGTGVGLASVKRIVERHGGRVWAESASEQGATFYFTLSASGKEASPAGAQEIAGERHPA